MEIILFYLGIFVGLPLLYSLFFLISFFYTKIKYQRRLKKITPDLVLFDLEKIRQQHLKITNDFHLQQKDLTSVFKINIDKKNKTVDDFIKAAEKERTEKKKKKKYSNYRRY